MANHKRQIGIALIEAMVALLVFSLGMLAISKFNAYVVGSTGLTKARAEATHMAQGKIEELRNRATQQQLNALSNDSDTPQGISTNFNRTWTVSDPTVDPITIAVTVSWTGSDGRPESVALNSRYSWSNPTLSNLIADRDSNGASGVDVRKPGPTGALRAATPADQKKFDEGTKSWEKEGKVAYVDNTGYVLDDAGKVRYVLDKKNNNKQYFTWIRGKVYFYVESTTGKKITLSYNPACTDVNLSSNGYCYKTPKIPTTDLIAERSSPNGKFRDYEYECVVGEGWYGNVIVITGDFDPANANNCAQSDLKTPLFCVGDPNFLSSSTSTTTLTWNPTVFGRKYYGFKTENSILTNAGVAGGSNYPPDGKPKPSEFTLTCPNHEHPELNISNIDKNHLHHHFLVAAAATPASGNKDKCKTLMDSEASIFACNSGSNVCLDPIAGSSATGECPASWPGWTN